MKRHFAVILAAILTFCGSVALTSCGNKDKVVDKNEQQQENKTSGMKGQLLEVYDVKGSEATARLTIDGKVLFTTTVFIGKNGIGKTSEGDGKTPKGTLHVVKAFGVKAKPRGCRFQYIDVTPTTYACDDDCEWYNKIIDVSKVGHECHGEDMYNIVPQYNYGLTTDYNAECDHSKGSNIFIHCKHTKRRLTAGCIAFDEDKMVEILNHCDTSLIVKISN